MGDCTLLTEKQQNILRGKALVGRCNKVEVLKLFDLIDAMEDLLDRTDLDDYFGTEGWRKVLGSSEI